MSLSCFFYNICFPSLVFFFSVGPAVCLFNFIYCIQPSTQNHQRQGKCSNITSPTPLCYSCTSKQRMIMLWLCKKTKKTKTEISSYYLEKWKNSSLGHMQTPCEFVAQLLSPIYHLKTAIHF